MREVPVHDYPAAARDRYIQNSACHRQRGPFGGRSSHDRSCPQSFGAVCARTCLCHGVGRLGIRWSCPSRRVARGNGCQLDDPFPESPAVAGPWSCRNRLARASPCCRSVRSCFAGGPDGTSALVDHRQRPAGGISPDARGRGLAGHSPGCRRRQLAQGTVGVGRGRPHGGGAEWDPGGAIAPQPGRGAL